MSIMKWSKGIVSVTFTDLSDFKSHCSLQFLRNVLFIVFVFFIFTNQNA